MHSSDFCPFDTLKIKRKGWGFKNDKVWRDPSNQLQQINSNKSKLRTVWQFQNSIPKPTPPTWNLNYQAKAWRRGIAISAVFEIKRESSTCAYAFVFFACIWHVLQYIYIYRYPRGCSNSFDSSLHVTVGNSVVIRIDNASCHIVRLSTELQRHGFPFFKSFATKKTFKKMDSKGSHDCLL